MYNHFPMELRGCNSCGEIECLEFDDSRLNDPLSPQQEMHSSTLLMTVHFTSPNEFSHFPPIILSFHFIHTNTLNAWKLIPVWTTCYCLSTMFFFFFSSLLIIFVLFWLLFIHAFIFIHRIVFPILILWFANLYFLLFPTKRSGTENIYKFSFLAFLLYFHSQFVSVGFEMDSWDR